MLSFFLNYSKTSGLSAFQLWNTCPLILPNINAVAL